MAYQGILGVINKNSVMPEEFAKRMLTKFKSCVSLALVDGGDILTIVKDAPMELSEFMEINNDNKDKTLLFYAGQYPATGYAKECLQPFSLLKDDKGDNILMCFTEGEFNQFAVKDSPMSNDYHFVEKMLRPEIEQQFKLGNNIEKLMGELANPIWDMKFKMFTSPRGSILFLAKTGELAAVGSNDQGGKWEWGLSSHTLGWKEKSEGVIQQTVKAAKGVFTKAGAAPQIASTEPVKQPSTPPKTDTAIGAALDNAKKENGEIHTVDIEVPVDLKNRKSRKNWFKAKFGIHPHGWETAKGYRVSTNADGKKTFTEFSNIPDFQRVVAPAVKEEVVQETARLVKDTASKNIPAAAPTGATAEPLALIPPDVKQDIIDNWLTRAEIKKAIDEARERTIHPRTMQSLETDVPSFFAQLGHKPTDFMALSYEQIRQFCLAVPDQVAAWIYSQNAEIEKLHIENTKLMEKVTAPQKEVAPPPKKAASGGSAFDFIG